MGWEFRAPLRALMPMGGGAPKIRGKVDVLNKHTRPTPRAYMGKMRNDSWRYAPTAGGSKVETPLGANSSH